MGMIGAIGGLPLAPIIIPRTVGRTLRGHGKTGILMVTLTKWVTSIMGIGKETSLQTTTPEITLRTGGPILMNPGKAGSFMDGLITLRIGITGKKTSILATTGLRNRIPGI
jgi:hypothetical protein